MSEETKDSVCAEHKAMVESVNDLKKAIFGNGRPGLKEKVIKLEVMIWIVITLLIGNGGLLVYTLSIFKK